MNAIDQSLTDKSGGGGMVDSAVPTLTRSPVNTVIGLLMFGLTFFSAGIGVIEATVEKHDSLFVISLMLFVASGCILWLVDPT